MAKITARQLLENGVHFGHQTHRWNPKMKRYILTQKNGIYIIDLQQSIEHINKVYEFIKQTVAKGGDILFVGTKRQAQNVIAAQATRVGQPYINHRWLGGMLTNFGTISKRLSRLKELESIDFENANNVNSKGGKSTNTKKELLLLRREKEKLSNVLGGIRDMKRLPSAVWVVDINKEHLVIDEAHKLGIPVIAIADTNVDPESIDYLIAGNDDSISSIEFLTTIVGDAVAAGLVQRAVAPADDTTSNVTTSGQISGEDLPEWEKELLGLNNTDTSSSIAKNLDDEETAKEEKVLSKATKTTAKKETK